MLLLELPDCALRLWAKNAVDHKLGAAHLVERFLDPTNVCLVAPDRHGFLKALAESCPLRPHDHLVRWDAHLAVSQQTRKTLRAGVGKRPALDDLHVNSRPVALRNQSGELDL